MTPKYTPSNLKQAGHRKVTSNNESNPSVKKVVAAKMPGDPTGKAKQVVVTPAVPSTKGVPPLPRAPQLDGENANVAAGSSSDQGAEA